MRGEEKIKLSVIYFQQCDSFLGSIQSFSPFGEETWVGGQ